MNGSLDHRHEVTPLSRINVTPIIDVALVLVIVLLITAPMLAVTDRSLELPPATSRSGAPEERIFLTLGRDGVVGVDEERVARENLHNVLAESLKRHKGAVVIVRADATVSHAVVRELLVEARAAGATRLAVATRPEDGR